MQRNVNLLNSDSLLTFTITYLIRGWSFIMRLITCFVLIYAFCISNPYGMATIYSIYVVYICKYI